MKTKKVLSNYFSKKTVNVVASNLTKYLTEELNYDEFQNAPIFEHLGKSNFSLKLIKIDLQLKEIKKKIKIMKISKDGELNSILSQLEELEKEKKELLPVFSCVDHLIHEKVELRYNVDAMIDELKIIMKERNFSFINYELLETKLDQFAKIEREFIYQTIGFDEQTRFIRGKVEETLKKHYISKKNIALLRDIEEHLKCMSTEDFEDSIGTSTFD